MTDLHAHILPAIDDGAKNMDVAMLLLQMEVEQGVRHLALTPHFNAERTDVPAFLAMRGKAAVELAQALNKKQLPLQIRLGAEVYCSPQLMEFDLKALCLQKTQCLLLELPVFYNPGWTRDVIFFMQTQGITPLIAHVERYPYMLEHPELLEELFETGALMQVNAASLLHDNPGGKAAWKFLSAGLVHCLASDAHSAHQRPPLLGKAFRAVQKKLGIEMARQLEKNASSIFSGNSSII